MIYAVELREKAGDALFRSTVAVKKYFAMLSHPAPAKMLHCLHRYSIAIRIITRAQPPGFCFCFQELWSSWARYRSTELTLCSPGQPAPSALTYWYG